MSRIKINNKELAKLREFKSGSDVDKYLSTEFKQVLRALQNQYIDIDDGDILPDLSRIGSDLYAINQVGSDPGIVNISNRVLKHGKVTSNVFFPKDSGKFWVEFGISVIPSAPGSFSSSITAKYSDGTTALKLPHSINISNGTRFYPSGRTFMDLTPIKGVYFETEGDASLVFTNFYCEIKKII